MGVVGEPRGFEGDLRGAEGLRECADRGDCLVGAVAEEPTLSWRRAPPPAKRYLTLCNRAPRDFFAEIYRDSGARDRVPGVSNDSSVRGRFSIGNASIPGVRDHPVRLLRCTNVAPQSCFRGSIDTASSHTISDWRGETFKDRWT